MAETHEDSLVEQELRFWKALPEHPAVKAILAWNPEALVDAKFDRGELTLTIAAGEIRAAAATVQAAGYNFFEDVTAVDWFPSSPRFQLSYHIVSHTYKERIRLRVMLDGERPGGRIDHSGLASRPIFTSARSSTSLAFASRGIPTCAAS